MNSSIVVVRVARSAKSGFFVAKAQVSKWVGVCRIPKYGSEPKFQKPNRAVQSYFWNSKNVGLPKVQNSRWRKRTYRTDSGPITKNFWHSVPNRTELWKAIPQTPTSKPHEVLADRYWTKAIKQISILLCIEVLSENKFTLCFCSILHQMCYIMISFMFLLNISTQFWAPVEKYVLC